MAQPYMILATAGVALQDYYDRKLLERAVPNLIHARYGEQADVPPRTGATIQWRKLNPLGLATTALTEGTAPAKSYTTFSSVSVAIAQYGAYTDFSDLVEVQAYDDVIGEFVDAFGEQMGRTLDIIVRDAVVNAGAKQYAGDATTDASVRSSHATPADYYIDSAELMEALDTLKKNDIEPLEGGRYVAIVHPDSVRDLFGDTNIVNAFQYAADRGERNPLFSGVLGDYMGIRFVETSHAATVYSSTATLYGYIHRTPIIGKGAYKVSKFSALAARTVIHPRGSGGHADPLEQVSQVGWIAAIAAKVVDSNAIVTITHITSSSTLN